MSALPDPREVEVLPVATVELLLSTYPLLRLTRGEKRDFLRGAWMRAAMTLAGRHLATEEGRLPPDAKAAALALHAAVIELGQTLGLTAIDFRDAFNDRVPADHRGVPQAECAIERCVALLSVLMARRVEAQS